MLDTDDRLLLVRFEFPDRVVWAAPGGGLEAGEADADCLRRELAEEVGLHDPPIGPLIWTRTHLFPLSSGHDGQTERFYLVRCAPFEVRPALAGHELAAEGVTGWRWWSVAELARSDERFAPRALPRLLADLIEHGPPGTPIDVGV